MAIRSGGSATQELTRIALVLAPRRGRRRWLARAGLLGAALALGAAGGYLGAVQRQPPPQQQQGPSVAPQAPAPGLALEQAALKLRMAEARGQELERQIDALNQRLRESQEQLTFFRQAQERKR